MSAALPLYGQWLAMGRMCVYMFLFLLCMVYILNVFILFVYMRDMMYSYMRVYGMSYI
jgi:hypothetical protein